MAKLRERLPEKRRKDAVTCVEYLFTASPDWWAKANEGERYSFVTPMTADGRLCAKDFIGGRDKLSYDQTTYAGALSGLGLKRGIQNSKAKHRSIRQYYADVNKSNSVANEVEKDLKQTIEEAYSSLDKDPSVSWFNGVKAANQIRSMDLPVWTNALNSLSSRNKETIAHLVKENAEMRKHVRAFQNEVSRINAAHNQLDHRKENLSKREVEFKEKRNQYTKLKPKEREVLNKFRRQAQREQEHDDYGW